ncbi:MAG: phosphotransferase [Aureispira sp.]|nr:phosphotransferase [Aureispira sp.]
MNIEEIKQQLFGLFEQWSGGEKIVEVQALPLSGSDRRYFRIKGASKTVVAVYNANYRENQAFVKFSEHFFSKKVNVPQIYAQDLAKHIYLLEDLGDLTLLQYLDSQLGAQEDFPEHLVDLYKRALQQLAQMQIEGGQDLDYSQCYPNADFNERAMFWDLNYFKYCFLKTCKTPFDEDKLEDDFQTLVSYLAKAPMKYFMFRDFQARNIMLHNKELYFIDYQGGKRGPLQYDVISLLYQAKANLPNELRTELLEYYLDCAESYIEIDRDGFKEMYYAYVLMRCLQVLGAYGFKGFYEQKEHFLTSIPFALDNLKWWLKNVNLAVEIPTLKATLEDLIDTYPVAQKAKESKLTVHVHSFSYKRGIPENTSGHGGGFVFDCRAIHNPGRYTPYKKLTGRDTEVIAFLKAESTIDNFLKHAYAIVDNSVQTYIDRGFEHLSVSFGCTGGQHRSVFSADSMAKHLESKFGVKVVLEHIEQEHKNWIN